MPHARNLRAKHLCVKRKPSPLSLRLVVPKNDLTTKPGEQYRLSDMMGLRKGLFKRKLYQPAVSFSSYIKHGALNL